jgi:hypothetical protein
MKAIKKMQEQIICPLFFFGPFYTCGGAIE